MANYIIGHEGRQFTPDGCIQIVNSAEHNNAIEAQELAYWNEKPDHFYGYIVGDKLTTFLGAELGTVYKRVTMRTAVGSGKLMHYRIRGNNGASYYGKHGDMQLLRIRKFAG